MKRFCKGLSLLVSVLMFTTFIGCSSGKGVIVKIKKQGYITMATNAEFEPFEYLEGDKIVGIDIDIAKKIADKLGVELKVENVFFDALPLTLRNDMCDFVIAGISRTEERAINMDFSDPYFSATQVIVVPKDSLIKTSLDLEDKRVGVQIGTTSDTYCTSSEDRGDIKEVVRFNKPSEGVSVLLNDQLDAIVIDNFVADQMVAHYPDKLIALEQPVDGEEYRIAVKKGNQELLDVMNSVISELRSSGEINEIVGNYMTLE